MFKFCHQKKMHHFSFMYIVAFCSHLASPLKRLRQTVMSQSVWSFRLRGSFGEMTFQAQGLLNISVCYVLQEESVTPHLTYIGSELLESACSKCTISTLFPPNIGQAHLKISKRCVKKDIKLGF